MREIDEGRRRKSSPRFWIIKNGSLYARLQYTDETGRSRDKYRVITDKRIARSVVEEMRLELKSHGAQTLRSDKMTFNDLAEEFSETKLVEPVYSHGVKISGRRSLSSARSELKPLIEFFGARALRSIKPKDLETYKTHRLSQNTRLGTQRKLSTVNRELALLRTTLNFGVQNDWTIQNPFTKAKGIISLSAEFARDRTLSWDEERRLIEACAGRRSHLKPLLICALDTAMRRGEIFKMCWKDVNFETGEIFIPQTNTKTEESRIVGMTPRLIDELAILWEVSPKGKNQRVFGITDNIKTAWKTACRLGNIENFRFHDCRHTATTRMIASGSPHTEVMKITGHSQIKTFLRYLNITSETANKVAFRLDDYLSEMKSNVNVVSEELN